MNALVSAVERLESVEAARLQAGELHVVPTEAGWEALAHKGKRTLIQELSGVLSSGATPEGVPERWRFVHRLPSAAKADSNRPLHPDWEELEHTEATWLGEATVTGDLAVLEGHFPNEPVVPGLAQLLWADALSRRAFPDHAATAEVRNLKFARILAPGVNFRIALVHRIGTRSQVAFRLTSDAGTHSSGVLIGA